MSEYVRLPEDVDGVPIKPGDKVEILHNHHVRTVRILEYVGSDDMRWRMWGDGSGGGWGDYTPCRHTPPKRYQPKPIHVPKIWLAPCPHCGGEAGWHIHDRYGVECDECGGGFAAIYETPEKAAEVWNRRTQ